MKLTSDERVALVFRKYPPKVRGKMRNLRNLVINTAKSLDSVEYLEETLKWGEPSYLTKHGSTIRMDWKSKKPDQYAIYFKCTSKLVPTFKAIYKNTFVYEGNRAIIFDLKEEIPETEIAQCIELALTYHEVKHLPMLGV